jgi:alkylation response protein AidB-like acyl-CoA dehydrogenase
MGDLVDSELQTVEQSLDQLMSKWPPTTDASRLASVRFDLGLAWVWFAKGDGGLGVSPVLQEVVASTLAEAGYPAPPPNGLGTGMAGPTVHSYGRPEQRSEWLKRIFCSGEWWCQLFSEPGAGSDIASLATRAVREGDSWVVTGQKVWTSGAQHSDWGLLVARTDPQVPKHRGITFFLLDMDSPGVEVKALRNMTGLSEFNEVFLSDVQVPDTMRIGSVGEGWKVLLATLMNERLVFTSGGGPTDASVLIQAAIRAWQRSGRGVVERDRLMRAWISTEVARLHNARAGESRSRGVPGHEGSLGKIAMTELNQQISELTVDLLGPDGMLLREPYADGRYQTKDEDASEDPGLRFLRARANTIEGGTSQVHRNNIGEHVLGLPGEPRGDKSRPWNEVPR